MTKETYEMPREISKDEERNMEKLIGMVYVTWKAYMRGYGYE